MTIPRILHHVWAGHDIIPYRYHTDMASWSKHNPDWAHCLWTPKNLDALDMVNRSLYDAAREEAPDDWLRWRADVARLEILYKYGGIYADTDSVCQRSLEPLREHGCWFPKSPWDGRFLTQAVFGCEPGHPFVGHLLERIAKNAVEYRGGRLVDTVGGKFITREAEGRTDVVALEAEMFAGESPDAFVRHYYANRRRHKAARSRGGDPTTSPPQIAVFKATANLLDKAGVDWWLTSGAVLGHARDGRFLETDKDIDIGVWPSGRDAARDALALAGFDITRDEPWQVMAVHNKVKVDVHVHERQGGDVVTRLGKKGQYVYEFPAYLFDGMRRTIFYLRETKVPSPYEEYLRVHYGEDWTTPRTEWQWNSDPPCLKK